MAQSIAGGRMLQRMIEQGFGWLYAVVAISGAAGGCMMVVQKVLRGRNVTAVLMLAYTFAGLVFGVAGAAGLEIFTEWQPSFDRALLAGLMFGAIGAGSLAGMNLSARFILRRLGVEVDVSIRPVRTKKETAE